MMLELLNFALDLSPILAPVFVVGCCSGALAERLAARVRKERVRRLSLTRTQINFERAERAAEIQRERVARRIEKNARRFA